MSFLLNAFIDVTDCDGNVARINAAHITHIEGNCTPDEYASYDKDEENRVSIKSKNSTWESKETPEEIYKRVCEAQIVALEEFKKSRLPIQTSLTFFNTLARFRDEDECINYISTDEIIRIDDENDNRKIVTLQDEEIESADTVKDLSSAIENAQKKRMDTLRNYCLGIR